MPLGATKSDEPGVQHPCATLLVAAEVVPGLARGRVGPAELRAD
ncbi:MAG TPA: hypothetical protein VER33_11790 [Polyangiaceae bacterium]|nr:hypothetical protein [Polyangiaceae bacterium]